MYCFPVTETLRVMRLTAIILLFTCAQVAARGYSQTVTLTVRNVPVQQVFKEVIRQTGVSIIYRESLFEHFSPVTLSVKDAPVKEVLDQCLQGQPFTYTLDGNTILIAPVNSPALQTGDTSHLPHSLGKLDVQGTVYNEAGQPLAGANVMVKKTGKGTITNAKGEFELSGVSEKSSLIISFIGYASQEINVSEGKKVQVYLNLTKNELDKVVIQAYGTTTQRLSTGNIATVTAKEIERQPVMNPLQALEGRVAGLVVEQTNGYASAPFKMEIRGRSSINPDLPSEPLYIIDGVPLTILSGVDANGSNLGGNYASGSVGITQNGFQGPAGGQSPLFSINPADIESITVLKDADATSIYGSRGSNGVIVITTKKGAPGKAKFELSAYSGYSKITQHYNLLNTQQYVSMRREAFKNDGINPTASSAYDLLLWDTTRYTDWQKVFWGGIGKKVDLESALSGGDRFNTFRISGGYHHETDILTVSGADQRASVQFNLGHKSFNQKLALSFTSQYTYAQSTLSSIGGNVLIPPDAPSFLDAKGRINWAAWAPVSYQAGMFSSLFQPYNSKTGFLNSNLNLSYEIMKGLSVSTNIGYSTSHNSQIQIFPISSLNPAYHPTGSSRFGNNNNTNWIVEPQLEYNGFISKGKFNFLLGASSQGVAQDGNTISGDGYINDNLLRSIASAPTKTAGDIFLRYQYAAIFGRVTYNWSDKYIVNLSARRDGSSKFGSGKQYGNFGAIGAAWIFTEEGWFKKHLAFLNFGKVRASYGSTGSDLTGDYGFLTRWVSNVFPYQGQPAYVPIQHANPLLHWEVNDKLEAAMNLGFLRDRLNIELSWYRNRCGDQLVSETLPYITGFGLVFDNLPAVVQNTGWEFVMRAKAIETRDFNLSFSFNVAFNRNKLLKFPNLDQSSYYTAFVIGQPLGITRLLHYTGVDPLTGKYTFADKNKDGQIDRNDFGPLDDRFIKNLSIRSEGGIGMNVRYQNVQLNLFFHFRQRLQQSAIYNGSPGSINGNQSAQVLQHWQRPGDRAAFGKFTTLGEITTINFISFSDGGYSDGSFINLQNAALSYELPISKLKTSTSESIKFFIRGQNLFILTKYNGIDPRAGSLGNLPPSKTFAGGLQFSF